jgi:predicted HicB family RNase H-like nuclease
MFNYKGFIGVVQVDEDEKMLIGHVINLAKDGITFAGKTVEEAEEDFHGAVDDYLDWAKEEGFEPEKPFRGEILVRATPELHRQIAAASAVFHMSINQFMLDAVRQRLEGVGKMRDRQITTDTRGRKIRNYQTGTGEKGRPARSGRSRFGDRERRHA